MKKGLSTLLAALMVWAGMSGSALPSTEQVPEVDLGLGGITPVGRWQADDNDSRYDVTMCGDGTQVCAKLIWIREGAKNKRNVQYLDEFVVYEAKRTKPAEWRGDLNIYGTVYGGKLNMLSYDRIQVTGCVLILCESFELFRKRNPDGSRYTRPE